MKTFLWTTLFWIIVAIAGLLCLGFGNLGTQVLENGWLASIMPKNLQTKVCDPIVSSTLEEIDWCAAAEANNCNPEVEEIDMEVDSGDEAFQESFENILANQQIIYSYLQDSFDKINQSIANLESKSAVQYVQEPVIDEREQQRLQLQAQIEALENEMANL